MSESCGKCVPCRVGTAQMHDVLAKIIAGDASDDDLKLLQELCDMVKSTSLCGLGQTSPNPVLSTLRYFKSEYDALLNKNARMHGNGQAAGNGQAGQDTKIAEVQA
jgi:bidirectional [NiFe] hydrogenase diaphorase subunit